MMHHYQRNFRRCAQKHSKRKATKILRLHKPIRHLRAYLTEHLAQPLPLRCSLHIWVSEPFALRYLSPPHLSLDWARLTLIKKASWQLQPADVDSSLKFMFVFSLGEPSLVQRWILEPFPLPKLTLRITRAAACEL